VVGALAEPYQAFVAHPDLVERSSTLRPDELEERQRELPSLQLLDVRSASEAAVGGTIPGAVATPLAGLVGSLARLDPSAPTVAFCSSGYRSAIAASVLAAHGFTDVSTLLGGFDAWRKAPAAS
jgi:hydroxyacylglutathione hydrolase